jgi:Tol biopolymer transport system component
MGEVYLAEDTTLDRQVALKLMPASFAADPSRRARFLREAKAVASLNHPNIVTLHSVEESGDRLFLTMEVVHGRTLAELIPNRGMTLQQFFAIAIPLAGALAVAHQRGIAHRDLKPSNVMVTDDGLVKVLDFGIAKAIAGETSDRVLETNTATRDGHVVGTPAYMSPEQAEGRPTDARTDIFSIGVVMFEMLTGQRPHDAGTAGSQFARGALSPKELRPDVPRELARVVRRCLAIDPAERYQSALDLRHGLEEIKQDLDSGELAPAPRAPAERRGKRIALATLVMAVVAIAAVGWMISRRNTTTSPGVPRLSNAVQLTTTLAVESHPSWSPDGSRVAYMVSDTSDDFTDDHDIWVAQIGSGEPVNLTRHPANDLMPSWSPDGREIAFFSNRDGSWSVYTMPAIGGTPRSVLPLPDLPVQPGSWSAPQWSRDGKQLFVSTQASGENVVLVLSLDSLQTTRIDLPPHTNNNCWDLSVSPDAQRFAYIEGRGRPEVTRLWTVAATGGDPVPLTDGRTNVWSPRWSQDGRTIYYVSNRGGSMDLWQQAVAVDGTPGEALALTQGLGLRSAAFSADGTKLVYGRGGRVTNVWRVPLLTDRAATWADAKQLTSERAFIEFVDLSPDGKLLALSSDRRGNPDLWLLPTQGGEMTPLATDATPDWSPRWSPDASAIVFYAYRSGNRDIWVMPARGGPARQLTMLAGEDRYPSWSPDGTEIAFWSAGLRQLMIVPVSGGEPRVVPGAGGGIVEWSPTGSLVLTRQGRLFEFDSNGGPPIPLPETRGRPAIVRFLADGKSLLYSVIDGPTEDQQIWRMSLADGRSSPVTQFAGRRGGLNENFATDGKDLYIIWSEDEGDIWVMDVAR